MTEQSQDLIKTLLKDEINAIVALQVHYSFQLSQPPEHRVEPIEDEDALRKEVYHMSENILKLTAAFAEVANLHKS